MPIMDHGHPFEYESGGKTSFLSHGLVFSNNYLFESPLFRLAYSLNQDDLKGVAVTFGPVVTSLIEILYSVIFF